MNTCIRIFRQVNVVVVRGFNFWRVDGVVNNYQNVSSSSRGYAWLKDATEIFCSKPQFYMTYETMRPLRECFFFSRADQEMDYS